MKHLIAISLSASLLAACSPSGKQRLLDTASSGAMSGISELDIEQEAPVATEGKSSTYENVLLNGNIDTETRRLLAPSIKKEISGSHEFVPASSVSPHLERHIESIKNTYSSRTLQLEKNYNTTKKVITGVDYLLKGVGYGVEAVVAAAPAGGILAAPVAGYLYDEATGLVMDAARSGAQAAYEKNVGNATKILTTAYNKMDSVNREAFDQLGKLPPEQARQKAEKMVHQIAKDMTPSNIPEEERAEVESSITRSLVNSALTMQAEDRSRQQIRDGEQDEVIGSLVANARAQVQFNKHINKRVDRLEHNQKVMVDFINEQGKSIENHGQRIGGLETKVRFMQDYMFGKMSATEQVALLKKGYYGPPGSTEVMQLLESKEKIMAREKFQEGVAEFAQGADDFVKIASALKLDKDVIRVASKASSIAKHGGAAFSKFVKGDYLGAIASLTGIFGGGPSAEEQRHQEVMKEFKKLNAKLDKMAKDINKKLDSLALQLEDATRKILEDTRRIHNMQLTQNETLKEILNKEISSCDFLRAEAAASGSSWAAIVRAPSNGHLEHFKNCLMALDQRLGISTDNQRSAFLSSTYDTLDAEKDSADDDYASLLKKYIDSRKKPLWSARLGLNPVLSFRDLHVKTQTIPQDGGAPASSSEVLLPRRIYSESVLRHGNIVLGVLPGMMIYRNSGVVAPTVSGQNSPLILVAGAKNFGSQELRWLTHLLTWVDNAIVQETLLYGDATVALMAEHATVILAPERCQTDGCKQAVDMSTTLMKKNNRLLVNFVHYAILKEWFEAGNTGTSWYMYNQSLDVSEIARRLKTPWKFVIKDNKLHVEILGQVLPLASSARPFDHEMHLSPAIRPLLELREKLVSKKVDMEMNAILPLELRKFITYEGTLGVQSPGVH